MNSQNIGQVKSVRMYTFVSYLVVCIDSTKCDKLMFIGFWRDRERGFVVSTVFSWLIMRIFTTSMKSDLIYHVFFHRVPTFVVFVILRGPRKLSHEIAIKYSRNRKFHLNPENGCGMINT